MRPAATLEDSSDTDDETPFGVINAQVQNGSAGKLRPWSKMMKNGPAGRLRPLSPWTGVVEKVVTIDTQGKEVVRQRRVMLLVFSFSSIRMIAAIL